MSKHQNYRGFCFTGCSLPWAPNSETRGFKILNPDGLVLAYATEEEAARTIIRCMDLGTPELERLELTLKERDDARADVKAWKAAHIRQKLLLDKANSFLQATSNAYEQMRIQHNNLEMRLKETEYVRDTHYNSLVSLTTERDKLRQDFYDTQKRLAQVSGDLLAVKDTLLRVERQRDAVIQNLEKERDYGKGLIDANNEMRSDNASLHAALKGKSIQCDTAEVELAAARAEAKSLADKIANMRDDSSFTLHVDYERKCDELITVTAEREEALQLAQAEADASTQIRIANEELVRWKGEIQSRAIAAGVQWDAQWDASPRAAVQAIVDSSFMAYRKDTSRVIKDRENQIAELEASLKDSVVHRQRIIDRLEHIKARNKALLDRLTDNTTRNVHHRVLIKEQIHDVPPWAWTGLVAPWYKDAVNEIACEISVKDMPKVELPLIMEIVYCAIGAWEKHRKAIKVGIPKEKVEEVRAEIAAQFAEKLNTAQVEARQFREAYENLREKPVDTQSLTSQLQREVGLRQSITKDLNTTRDALAEARSTIRTIKELVSDGDEE